NNFLYYFYPLKNKTCYGYSVRKISKPQINIFLLFGCFKYFFSVVFVGIIRNVRYNYEKISNNFKENIPMSIYFKENVNEDQLATYQTELGQQKFIKDLTFVHKDSAANEHQKTIGEDFVKFLGFNPLQHSFDLHFNGEYVERDSIKNIELSIKENPLVDEVVYDSQLVDLVNKNIK